MKQDTRSGRIKQLERKIGKGMGKLSAEFNLIEKGDRILVGVSGGKDSFVLLHMLIRFQKITPFSFELHACHLDQGYPGFPVEQIQAHFEEQKIPFTILHENIYSTVQKILKPGDTPCSLCSRLRRGTLYRYAREQKFTKIALGHHADDLIETLLLNLFFSGQIKSMPPKLLSDDGTNVVIRPMATIPEEQIIELSQLLKHPVVTFCACSDNNKERPLMKQLLEELMERNPKIKSNILASLRRVRGSHLMDRNIYKTD